MRLNLLINTAMACSLLLLGAPQAASAGLDSDLQKAARKGSLAEIRSLLRKGANPNACKGLLVKTTALGQAAKHGHSAALRILVEGGADIHHNQSSCPPATYWAAKECRVGALAELLALGADANQPDVDHRQSPLYIASAVGCRAASQTLIEAGSILDLRTRTGATALMAAAGRGHAQIARLLVEAGADHSLYDSAGQSALSYAEDSRYEEIVALLRSVQATQWTDSSPAPLDSSILAKAHQQRQDSNEPLTSEQVLELVQAGVEQSTIVSLIKKANSRPRVDASELLALRKAGAEDALLEALVGPSTSQSDPLVHPSPSPHLPQTYGTYLDNRELLLELQRHPVSMVIGLELPGSGMGAAADGFRGQPPHSVNTNDELSFIIWEPRTDVRSFRLARLGHVPRMLASQFNVAGTRPPFFKSLYGKAPTDQVTVDLWRPHHLIPLKVAPVAGYPDMYRVLPQESLHPGRYALYESSSLHPHDTVIAVDDRTRASGFYFSISGPKGGSGVADSPLDQLISQQKDRDLFVSRSRILQAPVETSRRALLAALRDLRSPNTTADPQNETIVSGDRHRRYYIWARAESADTTRVDVVVFSYRRDTSEGPFSARLVPDSIRWTDGLIDKLIKKAARNLEGQ